MPAAMSLCHCCPPVEGGSLDWERHNPLGRDVLWGCPLEPPTVETPCHTGVVCTSYTVPSPSPSLCAADHRRVYPASGRDHGASAASSVQGRPHRDHPHPDQQQHGRAGGKARGPGCRGHLLALACMQGVTRVFPESSSAIRELMLAGNERSEGECFESF